MPEWWLSPEFGSPSSIGIDPGGFAIGYPKDIEVSSRTHAPPLVTTGNGWQEDNGERWVELRSGSGIVTSLREDRLPEVAQAVAAAKWNELLSDWEREDAST